MFKNLLDLLINILAIILKRGVYGKLVYTLVEETRMGLVYKVTLPPVGAPDVRSRVVTYKINGKAETRDLFYTETSFTFPDHSATSQRRKPAAIYQQSGLPIHATDLTHSGNYPDRRL